MVNEDKEKDIIKARSKCHIHLEKWQEAVTDAEYVLNNSDDEAVSQAYCSKVEGLFNMCHFEQVNFYIPTWYFMIAQDTLYICRPL